MVAPTRPVYQNGCIPDDALAPVPGGRLLREAAAAFNAMNAESERLHGITLRAVGPLGTYRTVAQQQEMWDLYVSGRGNLAAQPGTSNHGRGMAIDIATEQMRGIIDDIGAKYGWAKRWSDAPTEWWHLVYKPGVWHGRAPARPDVHVDLMAIAQQLLRAHGASSLVVDGKRGPATAEALRAFQRAHRLRPSGRLDTATFHALRGTAQPIERPSR